MSSLISSGSASGTGSMTLLAPVTNSNQTATLPDATGTVMVSGAMPAFSAYMSGNQTPTNNVATLLTYDTKDFDSASCFNNTGSTVGGIPAYAFKPTVAGYYQINFVVCAYSTGTSLVQCVSALYKNATSYKQTNINPNGTATFLGFAQTISVVVYLNGTTDYVQPYATVNANAGTQLVLGTLYSSFSGCLVRAA